MAKRKYHKDVADVIKIAESMGFTLDPKYTGSGHVRLYHHNGGMKVMPASPSAPSWKRNAINDLRKIADGTWGGKVERTQK